VIFYSAFEISRNRIVQSFSQQGDTQNDMKIETLAEGRNIERRKKETNLSHAFTFVDNKWKLTITSCVNMFTVPAFDVYLLKGKSLL
jgi:hypothetical protein